MTETEIGEPTHPEGLTEAQEELAKDLLNIRAIEFGGDYRLKLHDTHLEAPLFNLWQVPRHPHAKAVAVNVYQELLSPLKFDLLADISTTVTPIVSSLSGRLNVRMVSPRVDSKGYGSGNKVEGLLPRDKRSRVILIDGLITDGASKIKAAEILEDHALFIEDIVVLIDIEQGGKEELDKAGYDLHAAFTLDQMLNYYLRTGLIDRQIYKDTKAKL